MLQPATPVPAAIPQGVAVPRFCARCGYDISCLRVRACPECGGPIESYRVPLSPDHARTLHRGASIAEFAAILAIFGSVPATLCLGILGSMLGIDKHGQRMLVSIYDLAVAAMLGLGWWLFSSPHPMEQEIGSDRRRLLLRAAVCAKLAVSLGTCALVLGLAALPPVNPVVHSGAEWLGLIATFAVAGCAIAFSRAVAARLGAVGVSMAGGLRLLFLAWIAGFALLGAVLYALASRPGVGSPGFVMLALGGPVSGGALLWYIFYIAFVDQMRRLLLGVLIRHWRTEEGAASHPAGPPTG